MHWMFQIIKKQLPPLVLSTTPLKKYLPSVQNWVPIRTAWSTPSTTWAPPVKTWPPPSPASAMWIWLKKWWNSPRWTSCSRPPRPCWPRPTSSPRACSSSCGNCRQTQQQRGLRLVLGPLFYIVPPEKRGFQKIDYKCIGTDFIYYMGVD